MRILSNTIFLSLLILLMTVSVFSKGSVIDSKHNLSSSSPGDIKSVSETRVCIFCHSSHNASSEGPLWNHSTTTENFQTYSRSTMESKPEQPNGATKLCLSCHDGTIAVGAVRNSNFPIQMVNVAKDGSIPVTRKSHIGTDLRGTHPVSVKYNQTNALASDNLHWPPVDPANEVGPDHNGYVQCTSCHDPHDDSKSTKYPFWKKSNFADVCKVCHKL